MTETAKRLAPKPEVLRELFLKSGNLCAFPSCERLMLNAAGNFVGQLCHIEAAEAGGERFNAGMTNDERRAAPNLMLMCYEHHVKTNDVFRYPVDQLRQIKKDHEQRFSHPDRAILSGLKDYTKLNELTEAKNLRRLNRVLKWGINSDDDLAESASGLNAYTERFSRVPIEARKFVGEVAMRIHRMRDLPAVNEERLGCPSILHSDLTGAFRLSDEGLFRLASQLESYNIGYTTNVAAGEYDVEFPALKLRALDSGWCLWDELAKFVALTNEPIEAFSVDLDFARLDED